MKRMEKISNIIDPIKRAMCSLLFYVCIACYFFLTALLIRNILYRKIPFDGADLYSGIRNYFMLIISLAIIHIWMYISNKKSGTFALLHPDKFFVNNERYKEIYEDILHWEKAYILLKRGPKEIFLKILYLASWVGLGILACYSVDKLGYYKFSGIWGSISNEPALVFNWITVCETLFIIGLILNYFSCFSSLAFCYYIRELSNAYKELDCREQRPSSTTEFQILRYLASRVSIAFFVISMLYILLLLSCIVLGGPIATENLIYFYILILSMVLLCVTCLVVVFLLPKVFLNRLLRRWKRKSAVDLDLIEGSRHEESVDTDSIQMKREHIWDDKLTLMKTEIIIGASALIVDSASLIMCFMQTF